jgi:hypothetical protein
MGHSPAILLFLMRFNNSCEDVAPENISSARCQTLKRACA